MKINDIEVTRDDFEGLLKNIRYCIDMLDRNEPERARWVLETLEGHLSRNLVQDKLVNKGVA